MLLKNFPIKLVNPKEFVSIYNFRLTNMVSAYDINQMYKLSEMLGLYIDAVEVQNNQEISDKRLAVLDAFTNFCASQTSLDFNFSQQVQMIMKVTFNRDILEKFEDIQLSDNYFCVVDEQGQAISLEPIMERDFIRGIISDYQETANFDFQVPIEWTSKQASRLKS